MNPSAVVELVPRKWSEVHVSLLHAYESNFDLDDAKLVILVAPQKQVKGDGDISWTEVHNKDFPGKDGKPESELFKDQVATISVPSDIRDCGKYAIKVEARGASGSWKTGWRFEGISLSMAAEDDSPPKTVKPSGKAQKFGNTHKND